MNDATLALAALALAPQAFGGVRLRGRAGPQRDAWLQALRELLPPGCAWQRMPSHAGEDALLGSLDLAATLAQGKPVQQPGLLDRAEGGLVLAAMAERMRAGPAAHLAARLDAGRLALIALDEGEGDDEALPAALCERLAFSLQPQEIDALPATATQATLHAGWQHVTVADELLQALAAAAEALGVDSARALLFALRFTRLHAALAGRSQAEAEDAAAAARLVLAPRATRLPPPPEAEPHDPAEAEPPPPQNAEAGDEDQMADDQPLQDQVLDAVRAAIPAGLLALLASGMGRAPRRGEAGRAGQALRSAHRGRPIGALRGPPRGGARLALVDTLRAAAPWQPIRRANASTAQAGEGAGNTRRVHVARDDLHVQRRVMRRATTAVFAIDASGSQAMHRLAEAKGAVELLLADCYARRDRVAVIGFRGHEAQLLLAPTRSLVHARRQLAALPGGGGTPLATGIHAALQLCDAVRRGGATPLLVLLTDGRANVGRDGQPGREAAMQDALAAAGAFAASGTHALLIDTGREPSAAARELAARLHARCIALPHADAHKLSQAVRNERGSTGPRAATPTRHG